MPLKLLPSKLFARFDFSCRRHNERKNRHDKYSGTSLFLVKPNVTPTESAPNSQSVVNLDVDGSVYTQT